MINLFPPQPTDGQSASSNHDVEPGPAVAAEHRDKPAGRPWVYTNMIASADGGTAVDGLSGALGGPGDKAMFGALRAVADVILVGASTVREERYRAPKMSQESVARRREQGRADHPRLAVVSRSLNIDVDLPLFGDPDNRPLLITTTSSPAPQRQRLEAVADVVDAGHERVSMAETLSYLDSLGTKTVLSEGGPSLNGQLIADGLIDEWNLSLSPSLLGGDSRRAAIGPSPAGPPIGMRLDRVWTDNELLFCRWIRHTD